MTYMLYIFPMYKSIVMDVVYMASVHSIHHQYITNKQNIQVKISVRMPYFHLDLKSVCILPSGKFVITTLMMTPFGSKEN